MLKIWRSRSDILLYLLSFPSFGSLRPLFAKITLNTSDTVSLNVNSGIWNVRESITYFYLWLICQINTLCGQWSTPVLVLDFRLCYGKAQMEFTDFCRIYFNAIKHTLSKQLAHKCQRICRTKCMMDEFCKHRFHEGLVIAFFSQKNPGHSYPLTQLPFTALLSCITFRALQKKTHTDNCMQLQALLCIIQLKSLRKDTEHLDSRKSYIFPRWSWWARLPILPSCALWSWSPRWPWYSNWSYSSLVHIKRQKQYSTWFSLLINIYTYWRVSSSLQNRSITHLSF